jgi:hypothetical protein
VDRDVVVIWIGGVGYGGVETFGVEFNLRNDIAAANVVYDSHRRVAGAQQRTPDLGQLHRAGEKISGTSKLADYLISQMVSGTRTYWPEPIESRSRGIRRRFLMLTPGRYFRIVPPRDLARKATTCPGLGIRSVLSSR